MRIHLLTLFPSLFENFLQESILKRAQVDGHITCSVVDIRTFAEDKHHTTDDTPYGGGPGMVMKPEPLYRALASVVSTPEQRPQQHRVAVLSPRGIPFTQQKAAGYATYSDLTLVCGRYEGIDQRIIDHCADEEVSIGPYVLNGGEVAAMVIVEAVSRLLPGVLGNPDSLKEETFSLPTTMQKGLSREGRASDRHGEYPQYTKPPVFRGWEVPDVLLSGNHEAIATWRRTHTS